MSISALPSGLNTPVGLTIYRDIKFKCIAEVAGWRFYATKPGPFFIGIWRAYTDGVDHKLYLLGKNQITATKKGINTVILEKVSKTRSKILDTIVWGEGY